MCQQYATDRGVDGTNMPLVWFNGFRGSYAENLSNNTDRIDMVDLRFLSGTLHLQDNGHRDAILDPP